MAQGNVYIIIPAGQKDSQIPLKLKNKWQFEEPVLDENGEAVLDENGNPTTTIIHPSWLKAANKLRQNFGDVREVTYGGNPFLLVEMELSFLNGEISDVQKLQSKQPGAIADFRILTNSEARRLLAGEDIFQ